MDISGKTSAQLLKGVELEGGWRVIDFAPRPKTSTGGHFSVCYIVESVDGTKAFLKALDYSAALKSPDPARMLQALTEAYNFERDLLNKCKNGHMDRIVRAIADGKIQIEGTSDSGVVQYLILELADGDVRSQATVSQRFDIAWTLRSLHHIAVGLSQLHGQGIAHQDLKPSNVLVFDGVESKLTDLGRAAYKGHTPPHDGLKVAGDFTYAPPELLYGHIDPDWNSRRFGCDAYLMGSMVVFFFLGVGMTTLLQKELPINHQWMNWVGSYKDVLPYIRDAFGRSLDYFGSKLHPSLELNLTPTVSELCDPDPSLRGHPKNRRDSTNQYSLERYVSRFNLLARKAELGILLR